MGHMRHCHVVVTTRELSLSGERRPFTLRGNQEKATLQLGFLISDLYSRFEFIVKI